MHIVISPAMAGRHHVGLATHNDHLICTSRNPFCDAARMLKLEGLADDDTVRSMSQQGLRHRRMRGRIGAPRGSPFKGGERPPFRALPIEGCHTVGSGCSLDSLMCARRHGSREHRPLRCSREGAEMIQ